MGIIKNRKLKESMQILKLINKNNLVNTLETYID